MGLCKCPKRKVTNQFCFEHRVNVCEHCMVTNHPKCVVQSYLQWLHDNDYNPICILCKETLSSEDCIRLTCYHVYHWSCLDASARKLPPTTAPAGYTCPTCETCIFPQANLVSPVADVLREKLAGVNWARAGLGLPLLSDERERKPAQERKTISLDNTYQNHASSTVTTSRTGNSISSMNSAIQDSNQQLGPPYSVVNIDSNLSGQTKKVFEAYDEPKEVSFDHDENKYRRKSAMEWFLRWWKMITRAPSKRRNQSGPGGYKRNHYYYILLALLGVFAFIVIIAIFSWLGRMATDGDPSYNLLSNPHINVERAKVEPSV